MDSLGKNINVLARRGFKTRSAEGVWALYRLGCYSSVLSNVRQPQNARVALARLVSACACGSVQKFSALNDFLLMDDGRLAPEAAKMTAAFDLDIAWQIAQTFDGHSLLKSCILFARGDRIHAFEALKAEQGNELSGDGFLLASNFSSEAPKKMEYLTAYFAEHDLPGPFLLRENSPLSLGNLGCVGECAHRYGPVVSVIMTTYNSRESLTISVNSVLKQSYENIELIIVDDASQDGTQQVIRQFASQDTRVRYRFLERNRGTYVAKNAGLRMATGDYITCNDSDDWSHPDRISRQIEPLLKNEKLVSTASMMVRMSGRGEFVARQAFPLTRFNMSSLLFRKGPVLSRAGNYQSSRIGSDSEFNSRIGLLFGREAQITVRQPLALVAQREGSLSSDLAGGKPVAARRIDHWELWTRRHVAWARLWWVRKLGPWAFKLPGVKL